MRWILTLVLSMTILAGCVYSDPGTPDTNTTVIDHTPAPASNTTVIDHTAPPPADADVNVDVHGSTSTTP